MRRMEPLGKCPCRMCEKDDTYCTGCSDFRIWFKISWRKLRNFWLDEKTEKRRKKK